MCLLSYVEGTNHKITTLSSPLYTEKDVSHLFCEFEKGKSKSSSLNFVTASYLMHRSKL